jgi:hypothetical protein
MASTESGDAYGKEWVAQAWRECGLQYLTSERTKVEIYLEALPLFTRGQVKLRPHDILLRGAAATRTEDDSYWSRFCWSSAAR